MWRNELECRGIGKWASVLAVATVFLGIAPGMSGVGEAQAVAAPADATGPARVLGVFEEIARIPRCSKHEEAVSAWLVEWARKRGLAAKTDDRRNVLVSVPASKGREGEPAVVLQAHMDMVCQKTDDSTHDFAKDPVVPVRDGDWLRASDTTLGADDGIGVAFALALAEDPGLSRPPLELLFTTDEEVDMSGAAGLSEDFLSGRKCINIDWETEGSMALGSAGGVKSEIVLPLNFSEVPKDFRVFSFRIDGLLGGHSGLEIDKNRANANRLVAECLAGSLPLRLISFAGGTATNAITRTSQATFAVEPSLVEDLRARLSAGEREIEERYPDEKDLSATLTELPLEAPCKAASREGTEKALDLVRAIPYGVWEMSKEFPGLPETSNNIGIVETKGDAMHVTTYQRSSKEEKLEEITRVIEEAARKAGASASRRGWSPAWPPDPDSDLRREASAVYEKAFGKPIRTEVIHAGLECGYLAEKYPGMDIVSVGPTLEHVHTPRERLYLPSVERLWVFLTELLEELGKK